jgi:Raf kinase inhibitor-like YbhB/YbcL family protein
MNLRNAGLVGACLSVALLAATVPARAAPMTLTSTSFKDGEVLDKKHAGAISTNPNCVGENVSPQLSWTNAPEGTKSFAIMVLDPEGLAPAGVVHWLAYGIPASTTSFAENDLGKQSDKYVGGKSTMGLGVYTGPCTPANIGLHHYTFIVMATDLEPGALQAGMTRDEFTAAVKGHVKGTIGIVGKFGRTTP